MRAVLLATVVLLVAAASASAARFTSTPPEVTNSTGPFTFSVESSDGRASQYGYVGYLAPGMTAWRRCYDGGTVTVPGPLADGTYDVRIIDDPNKSWYNAYNLVGSGAYASSCGSAPTPPEQSLRTISKFTFVVDTTPPVIGTLGSWVDGLDAVITVEASDAGSGMRSIEVRTGDGQVYVGGPNSVSLKHRYPGAGTWSVEVIASDRAGNQVVGGQTFEVRPKPTLAPAPPRLPSSSTGGSGVLSARVAASYTRDAIVERYGKRWRQGRARHITCRSTAYTWRRSCTATWRYGRFGYSIKGTVEVNEAKYSTRLGTLRKRLLRRGR